MNTTHTPGPWSVSARGYEVCQADSKEFVADCFGAYSQSALDKANARLIATAPELLALARQYASECGECAGAGITIDDKPCGECADIRAIIEKATQP